MKVLISGAKGLVGDALQKFLAKEGDQVLSLVRRASSNPNEIEWHPNQGKLDGDKLEGIAVVIHLAGESIASGRWTDEKKQRIFDSRVRGTTLLSEALA